MINPKSITDWRAVAIGLLTATSLGLVGFLLLRDKNGAMGSALFLLLPATAGFAVAIVTRPPKLITASLIIAVILSFSILLFTGLEGFLCVLMAFPLIALSLAVGSLCGYFFRKYVIDKSRTPTVIRFIALLITPFLLIGANTVEQPSRNALRTEIFVTSITIEAELERVWDAIKSVESIDGPKPLLLKIGLPTPVRCELESESVGSKRTCYFDSGYIEEVITEWNPPHSIKMQVTKASLPGIEWLNFSDASYEIRGEGNSTIVTRKTTITSRLQPAWYWRRLEELGVQTEHNYLFEYVKRRVSSNR